MNRPHNSLLSAALLCSVLLSTRTAFIETAREESLVIRPKKQILFTNAFVERPAEKIPDVPDEVFQREEILEQNYSGSKESGQAVYEPVKHAHKKAGLPARFRVKRDDLSSPAAEAPGSSVRRQQGILTWLYQVPGYQHSPHLSSIPLPSVQISVPYISVSGNSDIRTGTPYIPPPGYPILVQGPSRYPALNHYPHFPQGHHQLHHEVICESEEELEESLAPSVRRSSVSFSSSTTLSSSPVLPVPSASPASLVTPTSLFRSALSPSVPVSSSAPSSVSSLSFSSPSSDSSSSSPHPPPSNSTTFSSPPSSDSFSSVPLSDAPISFSPLSSPSPSLPTSITPTNSSPSSLSHPTQDDEIPFVSPTDKVASPDNIIFPSSTDRPIIFPTHSPASVTQPSPTSVPANNVTVPVNETDIRVSIVAPSRPCTRICEYAAAEGVCLKDYSCLVRLNSLRIGNSTQRSTEKP
ncbi:flocculation protein FLO11-like [Penaeus chinensis]|uniref:flocculation protein FLO11-like n=1 Tax=Penaeus chinensis TaxID=139456 RepID=UPI001FB62519|nr:flocculation protein FLO11-like [Penaeus chinensis]